MKKTTLAVLMMFALMTLSHAAWAKTENGKSKKHHKHGHKTSASSETTQK